MDEPEFANSPFGVVADDWISYMRRLREFNSIIHRVLRVTVPQVALAQSVVGRTPLGKTPRVMDTGKAIAAGRREIKSDFEFTHALILVAAWGVFEAFVSDACQAALIMNPALLEAKPFENARIPAAMLFKEPAERIAVAYEQAVVRLRSDARQGDKRPLIGVKKIEAHLGVASLSGRGNDISDELGRTILHVQQTRHVWAHRGGKADEQFVNNCLSLGVEVGDTVRISASQIRKYYHAIVVYGFLIINRHRSSCGLPPKPFPGGREAPFADPYADEWGVAEESASA